VDAPTIVVLEGDETGQELLEEALRVIDPAVVRMPLQFQKFDLSLDNRRRTHNEVIHEAADAMRKSGLGLKAATITPGDPDDVGSPNALLREILSAQVILRTGRRIPKVRPIAGVHSPISVVRMAVDGSYNAKEWREGEGLDEVAWSTQKISRRTCRIVAEFAFRHASRMSAKVFGGPKYTVSPVYEGMFKEEMDAAAKRYPMVEYEPQLIDATFALLLETTGEPMVIPCLNRDGDVLSDLILKMFGSIAGAESLVISFDDNFNPQVIMAEAPHGTAPSLKGKNVANPMAMILAAATLLSYLPSDEAKRASRGIREATLEAVYDNVRTADIGGAASTTQFTDEVIRRTAAKLEIWETM
jgi:isocitrate/isopropylmalate dehydrogenase